MFQCWLNWVLTLVLLWPSPCTCPGLLSQCDLSLYPQTILILLCSLHKPVFSTHFVCLTFLHSQGVFDLEELVTHVFSRLLELPHPCPSWLVSNSQATPSSQPLLLFPPTLPDCSVRMPQGSEMGNTCFSIHTVSWVIVPIPPPNVIEQGKHLGIILDSSFSHIWCH